MGNHHVFPKREKQLTVVFQNELVRITKSAFADAFQAWAHLKALRVFVESVLRYGLPPEFVSAVIKVDTCVWAILLIQSQTGNRQRRYENSWIRRTSTLAAILLWQRTSWQVQMRWPRCKVWEQVTITRHMLSFKWSGDRIDYRINRANLKYPIP